MSFLKPGRLELVQHSFVTLNGLLHRTESIGFISGHPGQFSFMRDAVGLFVGTRTTTPIQLY